VNPFSVIFFYFFDFCIFRFWAMTTDKGG